MQRVLIRITTRGVILALWSLGWGLPLVGATAYLPISGPSDLRFMPSQPPVAVKPPPLPLPTPTEPVFDPALVPTNSAPSGESIDLESKSPTLDENGWPAQNVYNGGSDILVTPQMMVPYFQGGAPATNAPAPHGNPPIWFRPPVPAPRNPITPPNP